jgi:phage protein U
VVDDDVKKKKRRRRRKRRRKSRYFLGMRRAELTMSGCCFAKSAGD